MSCSRNAVNSVDPWLLLCLGCFAIGVVAIGLPVRMDNGFPLDDSWIHQVVGRNAAQSGMPGFIAGSASSGSSSAIWPWVIALNYRLLPWLGPVTYLFVFNSGCLLVVVLTLYRCVAADGLPKLDTVLLAGLPALTGNLVWLLSTGMEHLLLIAAIFCAARLWFPSASPRPTVRAALAGTACGIAIVTRPEAVAFIPIFAISTRPFGKPVRELLAFLIPCALACGAVLVNNVWTSHFLLPVTFSGRKWLYFHEAGAAGHLGLAWGLVLEWFARIVKYTFGLDVGDRGNGILMVIVGALLLAGAGRLLRLRAHRMVFLILLAMANFSIYSLMLPVLGHGMRYVAMSLVFVFPLMALGAMECIVRMCGWANTREVARRRGEVVAAIVVTGLTLVTLFNWMKIADAGIKHINDTHVKMGRWLARNLPQGAPVASFDIGGIGYFSGAAIVDLGGLVDSRSISYLAGGHLADFLREKGVSYVVLPFGDDKGDPPRDACVALMQALALCDSPTMQKREMVAFSSERAVWKRAYLPTGHASQRQVLFHITWR